MNYISQATQYFLSLKEKGFFDKDFYIEYDFICIEVYKNKHPEALEQVNNLQEKALLHRERLR